MLKESKRSCKCPLIAGFSACVEVSAECKCGKKILECKLVFSLNLEGFHLIWGLLNNTGFTVHQIPGGYVDVSI